MGDEPRYTLDEARAVLAARDCASHGHDLDEVRTLAGETLWVCCTRCPARFVPVGGDGLPVTPAGQYVLHEGVAHPVDGPSPTRATP